VSGKSGNVCGRTEVPKETDYDLRLTVNGASWQLIIAGPDEQGTLKALKAQAERLGLTVSRQLLTVNCEPAADGSRASDPDIRLTAYRSPLTDLVFMGPVYGERKALLLSQADLFVLPTRSDNFGIAVAEALASGVPVICTKGAPWAELLGNSASALVHYCESSLVGNDQRAENGSQRSEVSGTQELMNFRTHELTRTGRAGWWTDIGAEPLAAALREAMSLTDEQRRAMGENGRRLVERKYRWETVAERMTEVYSACLRG
jgi:glycosyltransferase involved in cell wall biosynthesis